MAGVLKRLRPSGFVLWIGLSALLLLGIVSTLIDLGEMPKAESRRANAIGQRAVVDPLTGNVSLGDGAEQSFDVSSAAPDKSVATPDKSSTQEPATSASSADGAALLGLPLLRTEPLKTTAPASEATKDSLVPAPAPEVTEIIDSVPMPKRGLNDSTPAKIYAQPFTHDSKQQILSFVVLNAGINAQADAVIFDLPRQVSVAFSPYGHEVQQSIAHMRQAGHEAWGILPAMGEHYPQDDPGPLGLVASLPKDELLRRLHEVMAVTLGSAGLILPPDEALSSKPVFAAILGEIDARGLELLATHPTHSVGDLTKNEKLQHIIQRADIILDPQPDAALIESKLAGIPAALQKKGSLIVVLSSRPQTLLLLQKWLQQNALQAPATLAPLSAQWAPQEATPPAADEKKDGDKTTAKPDEKPAEAPTKVENK